MNNQISNILLERARNGNPRGPTKRERKSKRQGFGFNFLEVFDSGKDKSESGSAQKNVKYCNTINVGVKATDKLS